MAYEIVRLPYNGAVDADGHVLEPADLWENYLEAEYRDRAIRIGVDDEGLEFFEFDGTASRMWSKGRPVSLGGMGERVQPGPGVRYMDHIPFGAGSGAERVELIEKENLDHAILYPTIGILWESEVTDIELSQAYTRAYNRWIADFCRDSRGRLVAIAHLSLGDPEAAAKELRRAVADGCKGAWVAPFTLTRLPHGHPNHDVVFQAATELDVPLAIHPTIEPPELASRRFSKEQKSHFNSVLGAGFAKEAFLSFFNYAVFDRFPTLKVGVLESQAGWVGSFLDRIDALHETLGSSSLAHKPSEYFRRQCFISGDPDERALGHILDLVGSDRFVWATDYPHPDHPPTWSVNLQELVADLKPDTRDRILGANAKTLYNLS